jgi:hypothetical protein
MFSASYDQDPGYVQYFQEPSVGYAFSRPNVCNKAYLIGFTYFGAWYFNVHTYGHARSDKHYASAGFLGPAGYYQFFKNGFLYSPTINGSPDWSSISMSCD